MKRLMVVAAVFLLCGFAAGVTGQETDQDEQGPSFWMAKKLEYSQTILNGLATEDFDKIEQNALAMKGLNRIEYFVRQQPEGYRTQLKIFQYSVNELIRHSEDEDLDGATLAFTQMTISCINCHKQLRSAD